MKTGLLAAAALPIITLVAAPAAAQQSAADQTGGPDQVATALEPTSVAPSDIVVTARRRAERLRDVPIAATVVDAQAIADRGGVTTVQEIVQNVPGVRFFNTTSQLNSETSIRASGTARGTNADPSVGLFRNGMYVGGGFLGGRNFTRIDLFDIGRVEVLRGTQGALYGRNAVGGAVNFESAEPVMAREGFVDLNYGFETDALQLQGVWNEPLTDTLAVRVGIDHIDQQKGFFYNPNNDVYFDRAKGTGIRGQVRYKAGNVDIKYMGEHQVARIPAVTFRVFVRPGATPNFPLGFQQDPYEYPWNFPPKATQDVDTHILTGVFDLGFATLTSVSGFRVRKSYFQFDQDGLDPATLALLNAQGQNRGANPNLSMSNRDRTRTWSENIYLTGEKVNGFSWLAGLEILDQDTRYQILSGTALVEPIPGNRTDGTLTYNSVAAYGSVGYDLTEQLGVTGELRYTDDRKRIDSAQFNRVTGVLGPPQFNLDDTFETDNLAYGLTLSYKPADDWLIYGKVGTGYRAGGFNFNLGDPRQPVPIPAFYDNEVSTTYELGAKGNIAPWLYVAGAVYRTDVEDVIIGSVNGCAAGNPVCPTASIPFLVNAGTARSWGAELEANARFDIGPGEARLTLAGSRQDGKIRSGPLEGAQIPQVPDWIASAAFNYRAPVAETTSLFFNLNYQGAFGGINELTPPDTPFRQPAARGPYQSPIGDISLVELRGGVEFGQLTIAAYARNAFQYRYVVYELISTQRLNPRRLIGVDARYRF